MFREIRRVEKITELDERKRREELNYLNIKPKKELTTKELNDEIFAYWQQVFAEANANVIANS